MRMMSNWACTLLLSATVLTIAGGCEGRVRVYDEYHHDYHHWNSREDRTYHIYFSDRGIEYREYSRLAPDQQRDYWRWRHNHPDADRH